MRILKILFLTAAPWLIISCGGGNSDNGNVGDENITSDYKLKGEWQRVCSDEAGDSFTVYDIFYWVITDQALYFTGPGFGENCSYKDPKIDFSSPLHELEYSITPYGQDYILTLEIKCHQLEDFHRHPELSFYDFPADHPLIAAIYTSITSAIYPIYLSHFNYQCINYDDIVFAKERVYIHDDGLYVDGVEGEKLFLKRVDIVTE